MPEDNTKNNIFYRPQNAPDRSYESIASFAEAASNIPDTETEAPDISYTGKLQTLLDNLTTLLDIVPVLPEALQPTISRLTYILTTDTIQQLEEAGTTDINESLPHVYPSTQRPTIPNKIETIISTATEKNESKGQIGGSPQTGTTEPTIGSNDMLENNTEYTGSIESESNIEHTGSAESGNQNESTDESTTSEESSTVSTTTVAESTEDVETETIDELFPTESGITMVEETLKSLVDLITSAYNNDRLGIKNEYVMNMYYAIQKYIQQMLAVTNDAGLSDFSNLLIDYDAAAVSVSKTDLKHCHDNIARLNVLIQEECKLFDKTHSADNTLIVMRNLQSAYQQRKKYYTEEYAAENSYLQTESNKLLVATRQAYDAQYNNAVKDTYKHFNSATQITDKVLSQTAEQAKAKGQLIENDVDVTATTAEPAAQSISNTANVVPSITAENDLNNRYGTTTGSGTSSSSGSGTVTPASLTGTKAAEQIYNFIRNNMGLSPVIACGMLGNFQQENNLSPSDGAGGLGIMQWIGSRRENCINRYGSAAYTLAGQLSYMKDERDDSSLGESWAWDAFLACDNSTPSAAAKNFCEKVERPGDPRVEQRQAYAEGFYQIYNK